MNKLSTIKQHSCLLESCIRKANIIKQSGNYHSTFYDSINLKSDKSNNIVIHINLVPLPRENFILKDYATWKNKTVKWCEVKGRGGGIQYYSDHSYHDNMTGGKMYSWEEKNLESYRSKC